MSNRVDREGTFLAKPIDWSMSLTEGSQSVALVVKYAVLGQMFGEDIQDWTTSEVEIIAYHYWVKKDGSPNTSTLDMLRKAGVWAGDLREVKNDFPPAIEVRIDVQNQPYNGKDQLRVSWVRHRDDNSEPGGIKKLDDNQFRGLETKFGPMLRALGGAAASATQPPAKAAVSKAPAPPPARKPVNDPVTPPDDGVPPVGEDDLPF